MNILPRITHALVIIPVSIGIAAAAVLLCAFVLVVGVPLAVWAFMHDDEVTDEEYWADHHHRTCIPHEPVAV